MAKHKHHPKDAESKTSGEVGAPFSPDPPAEVGFPGPGYSGFGGSVGYSGSGAGGVSGGYAGAGSFGGHAWTPPAETRHDDRIHDDVVDRLVISEHVVASEIEVSVEAGEVTLSGEVETRAMKHVAGDIAESVPGVRSVHNHLHVQHGVIDELREKLSPNRPAGVR